MAVASAGFTTLQNGTMPGALRLDGEDFFDLHLGYLAGKSSANSEVAVSQNSLLVSQFALRTIIFSTLLQFALQTKTLFSVFAQFTLRNYDFFCCCAIA